MTHLYTIRISIGSALALFILSMSTSSYAQELENTAPEIKIQPPQRCYEQVKNRFQPQNFSVCGSGDTVYDNQTGLMWSRCTLGKQWNSATESCDGNASTHNWKESLNTVSQLNKSAYLSHQDWRLPNVKELGSLVDLSCTSPAIDATAFPNTDNSELWTSTVFEQYPGRAWYYNFGLGNDYPANKRYYKQMRVVRLGKGAGSYNLETDSQSSLVDTCRPYATMSYPEIKFTNVTDVPLSSTIQSEQVAVAFTVNNKTCPVRIENGEYEINGSGVWSDSEGKINSGDIITVRHLSSNRNLDDVASTVFICDNSATFKSTTLEAAMEPEYEDVVLDGEILFDYDSFDLTEEAKTSIDGYIERYKDRFNEIAEIMIIGHTDAIASQQYNQKLSEQRARSVADYIQAINGIPDTNIEAIGKGKIEPIATNFTEEGRQKNRRVVMRFVFK
jgi:outer membrane protein OmpA-like peptidoglycan-associated protein